MAQISLLDLFLQYVWIDTRSVMGSSQHPSSAGQKVLGELIQRQLLEAGLGFDQLIPLRDGSFLVNFSATPGSQGAPHVVYAVHLDTHYSFPGKACPIVHYYRGGDIVLPQGGVIISANDLAGLGGGKRIVTADGSTLLGADDKAGVAALVVVIRSLLADSIEHGPLTFWFCVDEETGGLDFEAVPAETVRSWSIFWTVDGEQAGLIDVGCLASHLTVISFKGETAHPGLQGDRIKPAHYAAAKFVARLAEEYPTPMTASGQRPFYYVVEIKGDATLASVTCVPRSFDTAELEQMAQTLRTLAERCAHRYGCTATVDDKLSCINTRLAVDKHMDLVQPAIDAHRALGLEPKLGDVRGGTDGAALNMLYPDLPAPNIGAGARNLHGPKEFLVVDELELVPPIILNMIRRYSRMSI
ncbi:MAG: M20/M25/M40 family metallo-hydrolase [bacterium]|nr:M20/M25/M40 family metallo-hydrolase [bacterium]